MCTMVLFIKTVPDTFHLEAGFDTYNNIMYEKEIFASCVWDHLIQNDCIKDLQRNEQVYEV